MANRLWYIANIVDAFLLIVNLFVDEERGIVIMVDVEELVETLRGGFETPQAVVRSGEHTLRFEYRRPWEKNAAASEASFLVRVSP